MKPDEPFNYWQNTPGAANSSDPVNQPIHTVAPVNQATPSIQPIPPVVQPQSEPIQAQPIPVQMAPQQPSAQNYDQASAEPAQFAPQPSPEPLPMYEPPEDDPQPPQPDLAPEQSADELDDESIMPEENIYWSATEYLYQEKNSIWFILFAILTLGLIALDIFMLKTYTFSALVAVMAITIIVYYRRPPAEINYTLSPQHGLYIGEKLRSFDEFKSFGVINDNGNNFIMLVPAKRFSLGLSVYFPNEVGEEIVDIFGHILPMEDLKLDAFDYIVRKLRI